MRLRLGFLAAVLIGLIGIMGFASPDIFRRVVGAMQVPPAIYFAAAIRVAVGAALVAAASTSRAPWTLRILGALIVLGGIVTPFAGEAMARTVLASWDEARTAIVRLWGAAGAILGGLIIVALRPPRVPSSTLANEEL